MSKLGIIVASVRDHRVGAAVAAWCSEQAQATGQWDVDLIDLKDVNLPLLNEPEHPVKQQYQYEHTKQWSARVAACDTFVIVTPEYNFGMAPALLNALDYLAVEWKYKAAGFVSYGGISGGLRSVQMTRVMLANLRMVPVVDAVTIAFVAKQMADGRFVPNEQNNKAAAAMLAELAKWEGALKALRG